MSYTIDPPISALGVYNLIMNAPDKSIPRCMDKELFADHMSARYSFLEFLKTDDERVERLEFMTLEDLGYLASLRGLEDDVQKIERMSPVIISLIMLTTLMEKVVHPHPPMCELLRNFIEDAKTKNNEKLVNKCDDANTLYMLLQENGTEQ